MQTQSGQDRTSEMATGTIAWGLILRRTFNTVRLTGLALLASGALSSAAQAATYIGLAAGGVNDVNSTVTSAPATYTSSNHGSTAFSSTSDAHGGTMQAQASGYALASASIQYNFHIDGPAGVYVPVHVQASGHVAGAGDEFSAYESLSLFYFDPSYVNYPSNLSADAYISNSGLDTHDLSVDTWLMMLSGNIDTVTAYVTVNSGLIPHTLPSSASAFLDPQFTIDPAYADRFTIVGVPELAGGVPEPASWAIMLAGLGAIGAVLRRRRLGHSPIASAHSAR